MSLNSLFQVALTWLRVSNFGFRVSGFGLRASSFGFRVSDFGFRVLGFGFRVSGFGIRVSSFGFWGADFGFTAELSVVVMVERVRPAHPGAVEPLDPCLGSDFGV